MQRIMPEFDTAVVSTKVVWDFLRLVISVQTQPPVSTNHLPVRPMTSRSKPPQAAIYQLVICDEINNAVHDGLLREGDLKNSSKVTAA